MLAAVLEEVRKLSSRQVPDPGPGPGQVLIKIRACGVCGTDLKLYRGDYSARVPVILGHEFAGEVAAIGEGVEGIAVGDPVVVDPNESCGKCEWCRTARPTFCREIAGYGVFRDGGFAEMCVVGERSVYRIPTSLAFEEAAFCEPVSCVVHCISRACIEPGDSVLVIGAGPTGLIMTQMARLAGANPLIVAGRSRWKLGLAERLGATHAVESGDDDQLERQVRNITGGRGADIVIEAVGTPETVRLAIRLASRGGRVVIFGFSPENALATFSPFEVLSRELTILGSWVNPYTFQRAVDLLASGALDVKSLISRRVPVGGVLDAIRCLEEKPEGFVKAVVVF